MAHAHHGVRLKQVSSDWEQTADTQVWGSLGHEGTREALAPGLTPEALNRLISLSMGGGGPQREQIS